MLGTCIIRTSDELTATQQKNLTAKIAAALQATDEELANAGVVQNATTVYNGVDYSNEYNPQTYYNNNPDLQLALGTDGYALIKHYVEQGKSEGRKAYDGVAVPLIKTAATSASGIVNATTVYNGIDYAAEYNPQVYFDNNPDLQAAFGNDGQALIKHYVENGKAEHRKANKSQTKYVKGICHEVTRKVRLFLARQLRLPRYFYEPEGRACIEQDSSNLVSL